MLDTLSPELQLAVACCRFPPSPESDRAVTTALATPIDWAKFGSIVRNHRIVGLANQCLGRSGSAVPAEIKTSLAAQARKGAILDLAQAAETVRLQASFDEAGIAAIFLKGATVGMLAYGGLGIKQSWDIDLLVRQERIADALQRLEALGYALEYPQGLSTKAMRRFAHFQHEARLRSSSGIVVELHWRLFSKPILSGVTATSETQVVPLGAGDVRTLREDLLVAYLIAHGQQHGWSRLKWLADLNAILAQRSAGRIEDLYASAVELGLGVPASAAFLLCARLFDLQLPPRLLEQCRRVRSAGRLVATSLACIAHPMGGSDIPLLSRTNLALLASGFRGEGGWRRSVAEFRALWTQPEARARYPRGLDPLYHLLRIPTFLLRLPLKLFALGQAAKIERLGREP